MPPTNNNATMKRRLKPASSDQANKEPWYEQFASFVGFFVYLLILKTFFLPLFVIPTGSEAETLRGEHVPHTCPNCGTAFALNWPLNGSNTELPSFICPNCRWKEVIASDYDVRRYNIPIPQPTERPHKTAGDRIFVHGWTYSWPFNQIPGLGPQRWDVVVFKVPLDGQTNYIKRLIGLPNERIELIDGDVFANGVIQRKTEDAERSLFFPYFDLDRPPLRPSTYENYFPHWVALEPDNGWTALEEREPRFAGRTRGEIQFATHLPDAKVPLDTPGEIRDMYAYNGVNPKAAHTVRDVRVSAEVTFDRANSTDDYFELSVTKYGDAFVAQLTPSGRVTLERRSIGPNTASGQTTWHKNVEVPATAGPVAFSLSNADYHVRVRINGQVVLSTTDDEYGIRPETAKLFGKLPAPPPSIRCAAQGALSLRHLLIERDIFYAADINRHSQQPANGAPDNPIELGPDAYFCCGDNSLNSLDGRYWTEAYTGPHLRPQIAEGTYTPGTVPGDQLIGRAFFVYWPGFMPISPLLPDQIRVGNRPVPTTWLPDLGRARWIH